MGAEFIGSLSPVSTNIDSSGTIPSAPSEAAVMSKKYRGAAVPSLSSSSVSAFVGES